MQRIELDWAADEAPVVGTWRGSSDDVTVTVELVTEAGPSGWPVIRVSATHTNEFAIASSEATALEAWLESEYGIDSDWERKDLLDAATID